MLLTSATATRSRPWDRLGSWAFSRPTAKGVYHGGKGLRVALAGHTSARNPYAWRRLPCTLRPYKLLWIWQGDCYELCLRLKCHAMRPGRLRSDCGAQDREKAVEGLRVPFTGKFPFWMAERAPVISQRWSLLEKTPRARARAHARPVLRDRRGIGVPSDSLCLWLIVYL